jgi:hypothetical protein
MRSRNGGDRVRRRDRCAPNRYYDIEVRQPLESTVISCRGSPADPSNDAPLGSRAVDGFGPTSRDRGLDATLKALTLGRREIVVERAARAGQEWLEPRGCVGSIPTTIVRAVARVSHPLSRGCRAAPRCRDRLEM